MTQYLLRFWGVYWNLWNILNEWEHKVQLQEQEEAIRYKINEAIHKGISDLPRIQHLYTHHRMEDVQNSSATFLQAWLVHLDASKRSADQTLRIIVSYLKDSFSHALSRKENVLGPAHDFACHFFPTR